MLPDLLDLIFVPADHIMAGATNHNPQALEFGDETDVLPGQPAMLVAQRAGSEGLGFWYWCCRHLIVPRLRELRAARRANYRVVRNGGLALAALGHILHPLHTPATLSKGHQNRPENNQRSADDQEDVLEEDGRLGRYQDAAKLHTGNLSAWRGWRVQGKVEVNRHDQ